jgi:hypothetical protein
VWRGHWAKKSVLGPGINRELAGKSKGHREVATLVEGCKEILVVDETHSTNSYDFKLLNLMVKDQFNLGYPVCHAISSHSDEATLKFVFKAIKERYPDIKINCCITDDDPALINSITSGLDEVVWHILCIWHIHRTLQAKLREHVKDNELLDEMYNVLCVLIAEPDEVQFQALVDSFTDEYALKSPAFHKYFVNTFFPKAQKWAKCFRKMHHGNTDTTMLVESFHNILKTVYLKRKPCKRLDDLLVLLLQIEEDYYVRYINAVETETMSDKDFKDLATRHSKGSNIPDKDVSQISSHHWTVRSQDKKTDDTLYHVIKCADVCSSSSCIYVCTHCVSLCAHLYTCSCPDMFPLCKHVHKVFSMSSSQLPEYPVQEEVEPEFFTVSITNSQVGDPDKNVIDQECTAIARRIENVREIMNDVGENYLENSPVKKFMLSRIEATLKDLQMQCKVLCDDSPPTVVPSMDVKTHTASNEKLKKQLKPFVKKRKGKKKTGLQRPSRQSIQEVKQFLLQETSENDIVDSLFAEKDLSGQSGDVLHDCGDSDEILASKLPLSAFNPNDVVLEYQGIKVSQLHLKALNESLDLRELPALLKADPKFVHGWIYDSIINVYFKILESDSLFACDSTVALKLYLGSYKFKNFPSKLSSKSVILLPGNIDGNHWIVIAVELKTSSIWLYNPLSRQGSLLSNSERKFLSAVAVFLRDVFPSVQSWTIKRHFDVQKDAISCGVHICWFGHCVSSNVPVGPLEDPLAFRKSIYNSVLSLAG